MNCCSKPQSLQNLSPSCPPGNQAFSLKVWGSHTLTCCFICSKPRCHQPNRVPPGPAAGLTAATLSSTGSSALSAEQHHGSLPRALCLLGSAIPRALLRPPILFLTERLLFLTARQDLCLLQLNTQAHHSRLTSSSILRGNTCPCSSISCWLTWALIGLPVVSHTI